MLPAATGAARALLAPFHYYNALLDRRPLITKSLTSGLMYSGGDVAAQYAEHANANHGKPAAEQTPLRIDIKRCLVFFVFGTVVGGPAYHYWFNYLNELPALLWRMKQSRQRGSILRAYALLKSHNIEVKLDLAKLPKAEPLSKWKGKAAKILADQLIFSSTYTLVFFLGIGMLNGAADRLEVQYLQGGDDMAAAAAEAADSPKIAGLIDRITEYVDEDAHDAAVFVGDSDEALASELARVRSSSSASGAVGGSSAALEEQVIRDIIRKLRTVHALQAHGLSWPEIWARTWARAKEVYLDTYLADCAVWPPLQLINFSFIPVRFQFLFVNVANLAWNTFLSLMANKKH